jgi:hypothetical protein
MIRYLKDSQVTPENPSAIYTHRVVLMTASLDEWQTLMFSNENGAANLTTSLEAILLSESLQKKKTFVP